MPPILFASQEGSFTPTSYTLFRVTKVDSDHYKSIVYENGPYKDARGEFTVKRTRYFSIVKYEGKWYVQDYVAKDGQKEYAFAIDESVDKLTKQGK